MHSSPHAMLQIILESSFHLSLSLAILLNLVKSSVVLNCFISISYIYCSHQQGNDVISLATFVSGFLCISWKCCITNNTFALTSSVADTTWLPMLKLSVGNAFSYCKWETQCYIVDFLVHLLMSNSYIWISSIQYKINVSFCRSVLVLHAEWDI